MRFLLVFNSLKLLFIAINSTKLINSYAFSVAVPSLGSPHYYGLQWQVFGGRYGPSDMDDDARDNDFSSPMISSSESSSKAVVEGKKDAFRKLVDSVLVVKDPQHIPSLLTKNLELVLLFTSDEGAEIVEAVLEEKLMENPDTETATTTLEAIDVIVTFAEEFVQHTAKIELQNKELLGKILKVMSSSEQNRQELLSLAINKSTREDALDELMQREKEHFTPGFLRHIDMECSRIAAAPAMTRESARLLETLRIIQARVLEELGADLGEAAQVLGQLVGYESQSERLAVLDAGLTVRGIPFAQELLALTTESLVGFQKVLGGADPDLVLRVQHIDHRLRQYLLEAKTKSSTDIGFE